MKYYKNNVIIGIDHGYGNIKTANHIFKTGVAASDTEPVFGTNVLLYNDRYYLIGEGHKEFSADKITDEEYFILTLAGIAMELNSYGLTEANVHIAAGLPLKWVSKQKKEFSDYLLRASDVRFTFNRKNYHVRITGVNIFPQGFAAIQDMTATMKGMTVLCDIGNGTMNVLFLKDGRPDPLKAYTEKFGTQQCVMKKNGRTNNSSKLSSPPCDQRFRMFSLYRRPYRSEAMKFQTKTPPPRVRILPTRFLTVCKVTVTFDPHFEGAEKERLPLLTPTADYENSGFYLKSDAPYREIPSFLRLCRCRGMRHTRKVGIAFLLGSPESRKTFWGKEEQRDV